MGILMILVQVHLLMRDKASVALQHVIRDCRSCCITADNTTVINAYAALTNVNTLYIHYNTIYISLGGYV
jgi:hypothetical protein